MSEDRYRFEEIKDQIKELLEEAIDILPEELRERAESYWYSQISIALDDDHCYMGGCTCSMQDSLEAWEE